MVTYFLHRRVYSGKLFYFTAFVSENQYGPHSALRCLMLYMATISQAPWWRYKSPSVKMSNVHSHWHDRNDRPTCTI